MNPPAGAGSREEGPTGTGAVRLAVFAVEGGLLAMALGLGHLVGIDPLATMRLDVPALGWSAAALVPSFVLLPWSLHTRWAPLVRMRHQVVERVATLFSGCTFVDFVVFAALAGLCEEVFFRGLLQAGLSGLLGPAAALAAASAVFGLLHPVSRLYMVLAALAGASWGALLLWTGNLLVPVLAHAGHDLLAFVALRRHVQGLERTIVPRGGFHDARE